MVLTQTQIDGFLADGFLVIEGLFSADEVAAMEVSFDRAHARAEAEIASLEAGAASAIIDGSRVTYAVDDEGKQVSIRHISMVGNMEPPLLEVGQDPRLLGMAATLLESQEMRQMINQSHFKRPGTNVSFAWHQDSRHRGMGSGRFMDVNGRGSYVQIAIAIDEATLENGPLSFIRGSQRLGHIDNGSVDETYIDESELVTPLLKPGDVALFGPYTIHGSEANTSATWRRVFINGYAHPEAVRFDPRLLNEGRTLTV